MASPSRDQSRSACVSRRSEANDKGQVLQRTVLVWETHFDEASAADRSRFSQVALLRYLLHRVSTLWGWAGAALDFFPPFFTSLPRLPFTRLRLDFYLVLGA